MENSSELSTVTPLSDVQKADSGKSYSPAIRPTVDIFEDAHGIKVLADLPGVSKDKLDVRVHDNNLYIEALSQPVTADNMKLHHAEMRTARFSRSFSLSADFDPSKIDASLKDGVLTVSIPRREEAKPRRIQIQIH